MVGLSGRDIGNAAVDVAKQALANPGKTLRSAGRLGREVLTILAGKSQLKPERGDKRFLDPTWTQNPVYRRLMQAYLAWTRQMQALCDDIMEMEDDKKRARFIMALLTDTFSPTNTLANPAAIKRLLETGGISLVKGFQHFLDDMRNNGGLPSQVDTSAFEVGENIATSAGAVVFRNELLELIQYAPTTDKVYKRPLLTIPPQINKFYVLDLTPDKSMVKFLTDSGFQYFVISWRNPTVRHRDCGMNEYVAAVIEAMDVVREITGAKDINITGACSGGITAVISLAHLAAKKQKKVHTATLMVSMLDTVTEAEAALFATESTVEFAKQRSHKKGYVDSREMANAFAWLRPNDLIWNYWVNNYLMGNNPPAFDILYWNNDATRLSAALHRDFIDIFAQNALVEDQGLEILGTPIDLNAIAVDYYCVAGITDHITPWKTCYRSQKLLGGKGTFVLANSGHIQSLVNPPLNPKAKFFSNDDLSLEPNAWLEAASLQQGSWWVHWGEWLAQKSGNQVAAPANLGSATHEVLMEAPGRYVFE
ncbi:alpha/beta fold hydrolase [Exilibacterium tricleocarpae]|uniref:Alpha/beta fold hydrolase n=2 Tax=Exilibacterium tricleocarpae TaxID=2591008 RepID=A0A545U5T5_9GAMM|nr:alpha/beta fold hydrolase [Exilibacterium tricleocarpae]